MIIVNPKLCTGKKCIWPMRKMLIITNTNKCVDTIKNKNKITQQLKKT